MEYAKLKVLRTVENYSLVSSFSGISHTWYIDNECDVSEDIGILEADTLLNCSEGKFIKTCKTVID